MDNMWGLQPLKVLVLEVSLLSFLLALIFKVLSSESFLDVLHVLRAVLSGQPTAILGVLEVAIPSDEEWECIIGDLSEEYKQFPSRGRANLWLYKQVFKSFLPLLYKTIKARLTSLFGARAP